MNLMLRLTCCGVLLGLAACGGNSDGPATAKSSLRTAAAVQAAAPVPLTFSGNLSQYNVVDNGGGAFIVADNLSVTSQVVAAGARLRFADTAVALDLDGVAGQVYRLYQAAFNRTPDLPGLGFHINDIEVNGASLVQVSQNFINSPEFQATYGNVSNTQFVTLLYANVLKRAPDAGGLAFHLSYLEGTNPEGRVLTRGEVLIGFSESPENKSLVLGAIRNGIEYTPFGTSAPSNPAAEFVGTYTGTFRGADNGSFSFTAAADGTLTGTMTSSLLSANLAGTGTLVPGGKFTMTMTGGGRTMSVIGSVQLSAKLATGYWLYPGTSDNGVFNASQPSLPQFSQVFSIVQQRCVPCHSATPTMPGYSSAPLSIRLDTEAQIRSRAASIFSTSVQTQFMPFGNATGMTQAERDYIGQWFNAGTP